MYFSDYKSGWILSIDPGTNKTGIVHTYNGKIMFVDSKMDNHHVLDFLKTMKAGMVAMETLVPYNQKVGKTTFETIFWTGRFYEASAIPITKISRREIKSFLVGRMTANDAIIRRAVLSLYPVSGGGATPQIGTKAEPGPLFGVTSHAMQALAVGITAYGKRLHMRNLMGFRQQNIYI